MVHFKALTHRRQGFTLVEILVVVGVILLLLGMSVGVLRNAIGTARERQTEATILKVHGLLQQRIDAFNRAMERTNLQPAVDKMKRDWFNNYQLVPPDRAVEVMVRKRIFQDRFPQSFAERNITGSASVPPPTTGQSSALLYWILTNSEVYGVGPVDEGEFSSREIRDTDNDGLLEFVDGWGRPLRFYRWPTHLFRCGEDLNDNSTLDAGEDLNNNGTLDPPGPFSPVVRQYASVLWSGLPAVPTVPGELDPLSRDPDDPTGQLWRFANSPAAPAGAMTAIQNFFSTPNTYSAFLIMSAGPDSVLGLEEPFAPTTISLSSPVIGVPQGRLAGLTKHGPIESHPINDNITNRKR